VEGGVAEDETESSEEEELPHAITYEAFINFSRNDKQRATLSEELKERGCGTLCSLLCLWWDACQLEQNSTNSRLWSQYSQATALHLHDNIRGLQPLTFVPSKPLPIILLDNFAYQATALAHLTNRSSSAVLDIAKVTNKQRRRIFILLEQYDITYHGNWTFVNTGYLTPPRYRLADKSYGKIDWNDPNPHCLL
jgi:quinol monooxygenase YgiN